MGISDCCVFEEIQSIWEIPVQGCDSGHNRSVSPQRFGVGACGAGRFAFANLLKQSASQDHATACVRRLGPNRRDHVGGIDVTFRSLLLQAATIQTQTSNPIMPMTILKPMVVRSSIIGHIAILPLSNLISTPTATVSRSLYQHTGPANTEGATLRASHWPSVELPMRTPLSTMTFPRRMVVTGQPLISQPSQML